MPRGITKLTPSFRERIWGTTRLSPWFPDAKDKTGEVWFPGGDASSLLIKFIFTSEKLSVQVHPPDEYALQHENSRGKTEMWHILDARPGATVAIGFRKSVTREQFEEALRQNQVEDLLNWVPARAGDSFFVPAGTVHAIGAGLTLCEIQQNSDVTYRLYDYGRPRELHLERGLAVSNLEPCDGRWKLPIVCEYFTADALAVPRTALVHGGNGRERFLIVLEGGGLIAGEHFQAGQVWMFDADCEAVEMQPSPPARMLRVTAP